MTFNRHAMYRQVEESATLSINMLSQILETSGRSVYKFGFGQSPFDPPAAVIEALRAAAPLTAYSHVQGSYELRKKIAAFHLEANGIRTIPEDIFVASGSKILLYTILLAVEDADVLMAAPSWVTYRPQVKLCGHNPINIKTTLAKKWRITPEKLRQAYAKKQRKSTILIINMPGNPDGLGYTEAEVKALAATARELNILVISDEIYGLLTFEGQHHSFANYYSENTITTTGLSKWCGAGGWRLGVALLSPGLSPLLKKAMIGVASETYSCAPLPIQAAAEVAYASYGAQKDYLSKQKYILQQVAAFCYNHLVQIGVQLYPAVGGFYLFPDFSNYRERLANKGITTSKSMCEVLLKETGVALLPGTAFGMEAEQLVARLAYVDFANPLQQSSFDLNRDCPKIVAGMEALTNWLKVL